MRTSAGESAQGRTTVEGGQRAVRSYAPGTAQAAAAAAAKAPAQPGAASNRRRLASTTPARAAAGRAIAAAVRDGRLLRMSGHDAKAWCDAYEADPAATERRITAAAAERRAAADRAVAKAVSDGKITDSMASTWRNSHERDPDLVDRLLNDLPSIPALARARSERALAAATNAPAPARPAPRPARPAFGRGSQNAPEVASSAGTALGASGPAVEMSQAEFVAAQRARSGAGAADPELVDAGVAGVTRQPIGDAAVSHLFSGPAEAADVDPGPGNRLTRTASGTVLYAGVPTRPAPEGGAPQVMGADGSWMNVDEFERRGLGPVDAKAAYTVASRMGGPGANALSDALPARHLGVI